MPARNAYTSGHMLLLWTCVCSSCCVMPCPDFSLTISLGTFSIVINVVRLIFVYCTEYTNELIIFVHEGMSFEGRDIGNMIDINTFKINS